MANNLTHSAALRNAFCALATGTTVSYSAGTGQKIIFYSGTPPTNAQTALSGNVAISTITALAWGTPASGVTALSSSTADSSAVGGTAAFYRRVQSDGSTVCEQGLCSVSGGGAELTLASLTIAAGATVSITSGSYTAPV